MWKEGGPLSANREYLRLTRERLVFDICAAPFGTGFFVSWRFGERPLRIRPFVILALVLALGAIIMYGEDWVVSTMNYTLLHLFHYYWFVSRDIKFWSAILVLLVLLLLVLLPFRALVGRGIADIDHVLINVPRVVASQKKENPVLHRHHRRSLNSCYDALPFESTAQRGVH